MARSGKKKKGHGLIIFLLVLAVLALAGLFAAHSYLKSAEAPFNPDDTTGVQFTVASGSTTTRIATQLEDAGLIANARKFIILAKKNGYDGRFEAGDFVLSPSMTATEIMESLTKGVYAARWFTIPEGYTAVQTAEKLAVEGWGEEQKFFRLMGGDTSIMEDGPFTNRCLDMIPEGLESPTGRFEGFLFPETYALSRNATLEDAMRTMLNQFDKVFDDAAYARAAELGFEPYEIVIIASIIEEEAKVDADRPLIASVIYNRLAKGMPLQIDATVIYAQGENKGYVTYKDTETDSPYNTYQNVGLPPSPICSPGKAAIEAALYPADTKYIYYVVDAKLDGSHAFSETYEEFLVNKAAYQKAIKGK